MASFYPSYMSIFPSYRRKYQEQGRFLTNRVFKDWYDRLIMLDSAIFKWNNLPDTIDERFLELTLTFIGNALFLYDDVMGMYLTLPCNFGGDFNVYGIPYTRHAYAFKNSYHRRCTPYDSVIIPNNYLYKEHVSTLELYARRLTEIQRTQDINLHAQRTPILINTTQEQRMTVENAYKQYDEYTPVIFTSNDFGDYNSINVMKMDAPFIADKTDILLHNVFNEALSFMGYDNANQDKRERLVSDEVDGNNGQIKGQRGERLILRQKAADDINRLFGLNISVDVNPDLVVSDREVLKSNIGAYSYNYGGQIEAMLQRNNNATGGSGA